MVNSLSLENTGIVQSLLRCCKSTSIVLASIKGFGAGAGNTSLEVLVGVLTKYNFDTGIDLYKVLDLADLAEEKLIEKPITISPLSIVGGLSSVFSAFSNQIKTVSREYNVDPRDVFFELGKEKVIGGQEDKIVEVAIRLSKRLGK